MQFKLEEVFLKDNFIPLSEREKIEKEIRGR